MKVLIMDQVTAGQDRVQAVIKYRKSEMVIVLVLPRGSLGTRIECRPDHTPVVRWG